MPHCLIEHSETIDGEFLMPLVFEGASESGLFEVNTIQVRTLSFNHYTIENKKTDFIHVVLKILTGRTPEQKNHLSGLVMNKLKANFITRCTITVEVVDIDRSSYSKSII